MAFHVILVRTRAVAGAAVSLRFFSSTGNLLADSELGFDGDGASIAGIRQFRLNLAESGPLATPEIVVDSSTGLLLPDLDLEIEIRGELRTSSGSVAFAAESLSSNDTLQLTAHSSAHFLGNILHWGTKTPRYKPCIVRCPNGTSGETCVTCSNGKVSVRMCC